MIRQYNGVVREITDARQLGLSQTARLAAMVNVIAADAGISVMYAKYHYLFWRPVTAIDPTAVSRRRLRPLARLRRRQPGDRGAARLAAASRHAQPSRVPGRARLADGRDGRRLQLRSSAPVRSISTSTASIPAGRPET